jgi:hypothetical protein
MSVYHTAGTIVWLCQYITLLAQLCGYVSISHCWHNGVAMSVYHTAGTMVWLCQYSTQTTQQSPTCLDTVLHTQAN